MRKETCREEGKLQKYNVKIYLFNGLELVENVIAENSDRAIEIVLDKYPNALLTAWRSEEVSIPHR